MKDDKLCAIPIDQIDPNPDQPRKLFDPEALQELADSIEAHGGLIQRILVRPLGARFEIVAGERRWRAFNILAKKDPKRWGKIEATVRQMSDDERDELAIIENLQRADITPMEEAHAFERLAAKVRAAEPEISSLELAKRVGAKVGVATFRVSWRLSLLNLAPEVKTLFEGGNLTRQDALEIARAPQEKQGKIVQLIARGDLVGWKATRNAVDAIIEGRTQQDIFGEAAPRVSEEDRKALGGMERRIESVACMIGQGWRNGECIVATKVDPGRASKMAERIAAINSALRIMERELRNAAAQAAAVLDIPALEAAE